MDRTDDPVADFLAHDRKQQERLSNTQMNLLIKGERRMKCANCPLYESWSTENDSGEQCGIFGDAWDSRFQYEDKDGTVQGFYIERAYIDK